MNARLHDSVGRAPFDRDAYQEGRNADSDRFRKLALLVRRGAVTVQINTEAAASGTLAGPQPGDLESLRAAIDRAPIPTVGRFEWVV